MPASTEKNRSSGVKNADTARFVPIAIPSGTASDDADHRPERDPPEAGADVAQQRPIDGRIDRGPQHRADAREHARIDVERPDGQFPDRRQRDQRYGESRGGRGATCGRALSSPRHSGDGKRAGGPLDRGHAVLPVARRPGRGHLATQAPDRARSNTDLEIAAFNPEPAAARGLDDEYVASPEFDAVGMSQLDGAAVGPLYPLRPSSPGLPPAAPNAGTTRPLARIDAVIGSRNRTRRVPPSPPRQRPRPPEPARIS